MRSYSKIRASIALTISLLSCQVAVNAAPQTQAQINNVVVANMVNQDSRFSQKPSNQPEDQQAIDATQDIHNTYNQFQNEETPASNDFAVPAVNFYRLNNN